MELSKSERDDVILSVLKKIESGDFSIAGREKKELWEKGWSEMLEKFIESGYDLNVLTPQYDDKKASIIRKDGDYVKPEDPTEEMKWLDGYLDVLFTRWFKNNDSIYEFGSGTGRNLVKIAKIFPKKKLYGLEWVQSAVKILDLLKEKHGFNIEGRLFDIFSPDEKLNIEPNSVVFTRATLEQTGKDWGKFLDFLLRKKPESCIHIEPIIELYNENDLVDYLAIKYHKKRNYLDGFLDKLYELENQNKLEILEVTRVKFGSMYLDPYSVVAWKPR